MRHESGSLERRRSVGVTTRYFSIRYYFLEAADSAGIIRVPEHATEFKVTPAVASTGPAITAKSRRRR